MIPTFRMYRGDDREFSLAFTKSGVAFNLTAGSLWMTAKYKVTDLDAAAAFQKRVGSGIVIDNAAAGEATLTIDAADTDDFEDEQVELVCDVQVKDVQGKIVTAAVFKLVVDPDVTQGTT